MIQLVVFEGLFGYGGFNDVRNRLLNAVALGGVVLWRGSHTSDGPLPHGAMHRITPAAERGKLIVVGHSMGGPAAIDWCNRWPTWDIDLLITIDPRPHRQPYIRPRNVNRAVNYHRGRLGLIDMQGYPVRDAENTFAKGWGHRALPGHPDLIKLLRAYVHG